MQQLLLVRPHPQIPPDQGGVRPTPTERRPSTGVDREQVSRIEPPKEDGPAPSTKTGPPAPPGTGAPEGKENLTRGTNESSNATEGSAFEGDRAGPVSPAKPGDPRAPAKAELGERSKHKTSQPPTEISRLAQDGKILAAPVSMVIPR